jgi:hypothetical protein
MTGIYVQPKKSTICACWELTIPQLTMWKILRRHLLLKCYKLKILHEPRPDDFLSNIVFSNEATFHLSGTVIHHSMQIWGLENPCEMKSTLGQSKGECVLCLICEQGVWPLLFHEAVHYRHCISQHGGIVVDATA